jgi:PAS domain S-box-containing protein
MADSAPVLIWMCDPENRGTWFNRPWLEFTGTSLEAQQGFGWLEAIHPDDRSYTASTCGGAIQQRRPFTMEFRLRRFDQEYRWVLDTGVPLYDSSGTFSGYIGSCVDITEHKKAEEERTLLFDREREAREKAEAARQEAENANRMKDEFLATLSHELRTPLNSILGWAHLLGAGKLGEAEKQQGVDVILRNAKTQAQLIEDLLDMSRIISGKLRLTVYPLQPAPILHAALDAIRPAAAAKGIELHEEIIPGDEFILADAVRLQQIVWNILTNAVKFTPEGGRIELEARRRGDHYLIRIGDTGAGIAPQFLPHIFDRFRQADSSSTRSHGGLGLGLSIVRHMVERHNGTVRAESEGVGRGATFLVELPLQTLTGEETNTNGTNTNGATPAPAPGTQPLRGIKVLIVEDEVDARQLLEFALHRQGAQVQSAADASEGWQRLHDWRPDVLISDIGLPEEDGYAFIERVRASSETRVAQVPALALTAYATPEDHRHTSAAGFQAHLDKPTDPEALVQTVVQLAQRTANFSPAELPLPS